MDEDKRSFIVVIVAHGGPQLEGSQQLSSPSNTSDQAWYSHRASVSTQDHEARIPGKRRGSRLLDNPLTLSLVGGQCGGGMKSPYNTDLSYQGGHQEESTAIAQAQKLY